MDSGLGIGFIFMKELVDVLKGEFRVESELGKGIVFIIVLLIFNEVLFMGE